MVNQHLPTSTEWSSNGTQLLMLETVSPKLVLSTNMLLHTQIGNKMFTFLEMLEFKEISFTFKMKKLPTQLIQIIGTLMIHYTLTQVK